MPPYSPKEAFTHVYNLKGYVYDIHIVYSTSYGNWLQEVQMFDLRTNIDVSNCQPSWENVAGVGRD